MGTSFKGKNSLPQATISALSGSKMMSKQPVYLLNTDKIVYSVVLLFYSMRCIRVAFGNGFKQPWQYILRQEEPFLLEWIEILYIGFSTSALDRVLLLSQMSPAAIK